MNIILKSKLDKWMNIIIKARMDDYHNKSLLDEWMTALNEDLN